jgi:hypothetical protein
MPSAEGDMSEKKSRKDAAEGVGAARAKQSDPPTSHKTRSGQSSRAKPPRGAKVEFVRKHLDKLPAEVVMLAAKEGLPLNPQYVSNLRARLRKKGSGSAVSEFSKLVRKVGISEAKHMIELASRVQEGSALTQFIEFVRQLGIERARDVITILETVDAERIENKEA